MRRRLPKSHIYVIALTLATILVVVLLTAIPTVPHYDLDEQWTTFDRLEAVPRGMAPLQAVSRMGPPTTEWRKAATRRSSLGRHDHYVQLVNGLPVEGSWAAVHQLTDGRRRTAGRLTPLNAGDDADPDTVAARETALNEIGVRSLRAPVRTTPGWVPGVRGLRSVVTVLIPALHPLGDWQVRVDDASGEVLSVQNLLCHFEATGWVFPTVPDVACGTWSEAGDAELLPSVATVPLSHLDGSGRLVGPFVEVTSSDEPIAMSPEGLFHFPPSDPRFEQVMCYHTITHYMDHLEDLGVGGYGARAIPVDARGYSGDNSFFSPATGEIRFGVGGVPDAQDPEIILHELSHALHHQAQPRYPETESSRALSEGLADYLACSFFDDPRLAEWDAAPYSSACPPYLCRVDQARLYPGDLTGQVHEDGLIWASALWSVRGSLGEETTDHILLESLFLLPPDSGLPDAAEAFCEAARMLYDDSVAGVADVVFQERGLRGENAPLSPLPDLFARAAPNPFAAQTTIRYVLPQSAFTRVDIVDVQGRIVRSVVAAHQSVGSHRTNWDGRDGNGARTSAGIYFYRVTAGTHQASGRLVHIPG